MANNDIMSDADVEKLFSELKHIDSGKTADAHGFEAEADARNGDEEKALDLWRSRLIDMVRFLSTYFMDVRYWEGIDAEKDTFKQLSKTLGQLAELPDQTGPVLIRYRGLPTASRGAASTDYVVSLGDVMVDASVPPGMIKRMGIRMSHLAGRLDKAFSVFSEQGIRTLCIHLPGQTDDELNRMHLCLNIVSRYAHAIKTNTPIVFEIEGRPFSIQPILDEKKQPDPNLTLVAGINNLNPEQMQALISKVDAWLKQAVKAGNSQPFASVYNAFFGVKSLKDKLIRPPLEINNVQWLMIDGDKPGNLVPKDQNSGPGSGGKHISRKTEKVLTGVYGQALGKMGSKKIEEKLGLATKLLEAVESPEKINEIMKNIYGDDFTNIDSKKLGQEIGIVSNLLAAVEKTPKGMDILEKVFGDFQNRLEQVQDNVYDEIVVGEDAVKIADGDAVTVIEGVHNGLLQKIEFYKSRALARKKIKALVSGRGDADFDAGDYDIIAAEFDVSVEDTRDIIDLLKSCFDGRGHFLREPFEKNIPEFIRYEKKIFEFLWQYLKETRYRSDRVAFLNALQMLIAKIHQPKRAIKVLIADFCADPGVIAFADRNALMLANLLIRKYNKELNLDIELTPEEVLLVKEGLDREVVTYTAWRIESVREKLIVKTRTIHQTIVTALKAPGADVQAMSFRFLASLEREIFIFLALVGGKTARTILRSALKIYGDPRSKVFTQSENQDYFEALLQHLIVLIRGLGRIGNSSDLALFQKIKDSRQRFQRLGETVRHEMLVKRITGWAEMAEKNIHRNVASA
jgi:hypothetical protein